MRINALDKHISSLIQNIDTEGYSMSNIWGRETPADLQLKRMEEQARERKLEERLKNIENKLKELQDRVSELESKK